MMIDVCEECYRALGFGRLSKDCMICSGLLKRIDDVADEIFEVLKGYEFDSFLIGCKSYGSLKALEDYLNLDERKRLKYRFSRELSRVFAEKSGKIPSKNPDVTIIYDLENLSFEIQVSPLYIYGRYRKRVRGLSQTRWICRFCNGRGCEVCGWTGRRYISVEEMIVEPMVNFVGGSNGILHGSGREDVDARMLGNGRPFIVEIENPKRRKIDLKELEDYVNDFCRGKVVVSDLKFASSKDVEFIKSARFVKVYRVKVLFDGEVDIGKIEEALRILKEKPIHQRTPLRVLHRRSDLVRIRRIYDADVILHRGRIAVLRIVAESGLYIKELISGDEGRTKPSLSEILGVKCWVEKLDVIEVRGGI